jgi:Putative metal-binding motif
MQIRRIGRWLLLALLLAVSVFTQGDTSRSAPPPQTDRHTTPARDFVFPNELPARAPAPATPAVTPKSEARRSATAAAPPPLAYPQAKEQYTSFSGATYTLNSLSGRYVTLLVPDSWLDPAVLPAPELWRLVDSADYTYDLYRSLTGFEPRGDGPVRIAVVRIDPSLAELAVVGFKGLELADTAQTLDRMRDELSRGPTFSPLAHGLQHNFDLYSSSVARPPADFHAWTTLLDAAAKQFERHPDAALAPDDYAVLSPAPLDDYLNAATSGWSQFAPGQPPGDPDIIWAATLMRVARASGPDFWHSYFAALAASASAAPGDSTPQQKDDLYWLTVSRALGRNAACAASYFKWPIGTEASAQIASAYGDTPAPMCADLDRDGFTPLAGDCDDRDASTYPGAKEAGDGRDHNCNGVASEQDVSEQSLATDPSGDLSPDASLNRQLTLGQRLVGTLTDAADADSVTFTLPDTTPADPDGNADILILTRSSSPSALLSVVVSYADGTPTGITLQHPDSYLAALHHLRAGRPQRLRLTVSRADSGSKSPVSYELYVGEDPRPLPGEPQLGQPASDPTGARTLTAEWDEQTWAGLSLSGVTHIRFWLSGRGWVATVPAARQTQAVVTPDAAVSSYRVQAVKEDPAGGPYRPLTPVSQPLFFSAPDQPPAAQAPAANTSVTIPRAAPLPASAHPAPSRRARACLAPFTIITVEFAAPTSATDWTATPSEGVTGGDGQTHYPLEKLGWRLTVNSSPAELISVTNAGPDPNNLQPRIRITAVTGPDLKPGDSTITVTRDSTVVASFTACVAAISPSLWADADGYAVGLAGTAGSPMPASALNFSSTEIAPLQSARPVTLFGTGFRAAPDADPSNDVGPSSPNVAETYSPASIVLKDGRILNAKVTYVGPPAQGPFGLDQIVVYVPAEAAVAGEVEIHLTTAAGASLPATDESVKVRVTP